MKFEIVGTINNFEDLEIWQKSRLFCQQIDKNCLHNPKFYQHDKFQIDRAASSIMDNIAEGFEREGNKEFVNFLTMSKRSAGEVCSQLIRAFDRGYLEKETFDLLKAESLQMSKMLSGFINYLNKSSHKGNKFNRNNEA